MLSILHVWLFDDSQKIFTKNLWLNILIVGHVDFVERLICSVQVVFLLVKLIFYFFGK